MFFWGFLFNKFHKIKRYLKNSEDIMMSGMVGHRGFFRNFIRSKTVQDCLSVSLASTKDIAGKHALVPWSLRGFCLLNLCVALNTVPWKVGGAGWDPNVLLIPGV